MEHFVQIVRYLAWPIVVLVIFFLMRNPFKLLISSIEEMVIRYRDFQASAKVKPKDVKNLPARTVQTEAVAPEPAQGYEEVAKPAVLKKPAKKVLATLWNGQNRHYPEKGISEGQWSFRILPHVLEYGNFMVGFAQLLELGLAGWEIKNGQAVLSKKGWEYAKEHPEVRESEDTYRL